MTKKDRKAPDVIRVSLWLCFIAAAMIGAGLVYYFGGAEPSVYERIVIYVLLAAAVAGIVRLAVWGFGWVRNERVSELGLHIVRFAVILTAVTLCVFAMMSADYTSQYRQSASNELRQQALAARIHLQDLLGEELGSEAGYYRTLHDALPELLDESENNSSRHVNLYLFVSPDKQPAGTYFEGMEENDGIFAVGTSNRFGVTASAAYVERVFRSGELTFSEYIFGESGFENNFMSAFVPVFTSAGRPVGVLEICEPGSTASLFGFAAVELLLRIAALIAMFAFGFYGVMQLLDIVLRPRSADRSCRVLSCGREAARPVLFFVSLCAGLPVMLLTGSEEMRGLITIDGAPEWLGGVFSLLPICLYLLCFLLGWLAVRKVGQKLTEAPSNIALVAATLATIALILLKDTRVFDNVPVMNEWYIPLALIALCGLCYGISYRTIGKYQHQSDVLFGKDKYVYLCTALGIITGMILGAWLLDASGEAGVKVAMMLLNGASCAISIILLEDLDQTVEGTGLSRSRVSSTAGLVFVLIPLGLACSFVWVYITGYLADNDYSVTARAIIMTAPVIAFCFGNRLRLRTKKTQRGALWMGGVLAGLSYLPMVWTPDPVMAIAACGLLCLSVVFLSAGVYSALQPEERSVPFGVLASAAALGAMGFSVLGGFYASRLCLLIIGAVSVVMSFALLATKFPNRIDAPEYREGITEKEEPPVPALAGSVDDEKDDSDVGFTPVFVPAAEPETREDEPEKTEEPEEEFRPFIWIDSEENNESFPEAQDSIPQTEELPETQPETKIYDWEKVDTQIADVMSEFLGTKDADGTEDQRSAAEETVKSEPVVKPIVPDSDTLSGDTSDNSVFARFLGEDEDFKMHIPVTEAPPAQKSTESNNSGFFDE